ncbi:MAG: hypothetical protein ACK4PR_11040 [Gammaproteobacteria bacterium]
MSNPNLTEMSWEAARKLITKVNPKLAEIIDAWSPPSSYKLYKIAYRYGDPIFQNGVFNLPDAKGNLLSIHHNSISSDIRDALSYRAMPLGVIIKNGQEVFLELDDRIICVTFFKPGAFLGLWESLDSVVSFYPKQIWTVNAGARSMFMLPKISEFGAHQKLCKALGLRANIPKTMSEHQPMFVEIAKHLNSDWRHEVLFFSNKWMERDESNVGWLRFHHHLLEEGWSATEYNRNQNSFEFIWESFARSLEKTRRKPSLYLLNTLQHLVGIGNGKIPGFQMALNDESAGPIKIIQDAYTQFYGLRLYFPTIIQPQYFDRNCKEHPLYYSLQFPTCFETLPKNRVRNCLIDDLRELKDLMDHFIFEAKRGTLRIANTPFEDVINNLHFDYIHSDKDVYNKIMLSDHISEIDSNFKLPPSSTHDERKFALSSPFLRGCVAIRNR